MYLYGVVLVYNIYEMKKGKEEEMAELMVSYIDSLEKNIEELEKENKELKERVAELEKENKYLQEGIDSVTSAYFDR